MQCGWEGLQLAGRFSNSGVQISLNKAQTTTNSNPRSCHSRETRIPFSFMLTTASRHPRKASIGHRHGAICCYPCAAPDQQNRHRSLVNGLSSSRRRHGARRSRGIGAIVGVPPGFCKIHCRCRLPQPLPPLHQLRFTQKIQDWVTPNVSGMSPMSTGTSSTRAATARASPMGSRGI